MGTFILPLGATIDAGDAPTHLASSPLLEAILVEILTTRGFAPDDVLIRLHIEDAYGTLAIDGLTHDLAGRWFHGLLWSEIWSAGDRGVGEYLF